MIDAPGNRGPGNRGLGNRGFGNRCLGNGIRRLRAANASPMTHTGTNTYLVGAGDVAVIDPGPADPAHLAAILAALRTGERISHIFVTHAHLDHSPLARPLAEATGAPVLAFGDAMAGRSAVMARLAARGLTGGGEGVDAGFVPDLRLADGDCLDHPAGGWALRALHTPGHFGNHLCLASGDALFTGDHVMGWASSLVSPPDGDLTDFMAACRRLQGEAARRFLPGHGDPVTDPQARLNWLIAHRTARETAILDGLKQGPATVSALTAAIYTDIDPRMLPAAERNVFAHLVDLHGRNLTEAEPELSLTARFHLSSPN